MHASHFFGALCALIMITAAAPLVGRADAQTAAAVALIWRTPADSQCASAEDIRARVARLSERPLSLSETPADYRIQVLVRAEASSWRATITTVDARGRELGERIVQGRSPSCGSVDVAATVVIATLLDGLPRRAAATRTGSTASDAAADSGRSGLGAAAFLALSPELIPSAWLGTGFTVWVGSSMRVVLEATAYPPAERLDALGRGAQLWAVHGGVGLCPALLHSRALDLHLCASAQLGLQVASGIGLTRTKDAPLPLAFASLGPSLLWKITGAFALRASLSGGLVAVRPTVHWDIEGEPQRTLHGSRFVLLAQIGIAISP